MPWTTDSPKVEGWYWRRWKEGDTPYIVHVFGTVDMLYYSVTCERLEIKTGEWFGPIEMPT